MIGGIDLEYLKIVAIASFFFPLFSLVQMNIIFNKKKLSFVNKILLNIIFIGIFVIFQKYILQNKLMIMMKIESIIAIGIFIISTIISFKKYINKN